MNTTTATIVSDSIAVSLAADSAAGASSSFDDYNRGDNRHGESNVSSSTTTIVTDPDSPEEDFDSPEEEDEEDSLEEDGYDDGNDDGEDDGNTYEDSGAENFKCHDLDDDACNVVGNDNDNSHSTMTWHHVQQGQAGHEIDCEEEFGDDGDGYAEGGIEVEEDEHQDDGDLSDSGDDGTDGHHDVDDISIDDDDDEYGSSQEYETDEDSLDDVNECDPTMVDVDHDDNDGASSIASSLFGPKPNRLLGNGTSHLQHHQHQQQHELFLPVETAPTIESLKYEEEDDDDDSNSTNESSSDEDANDDDDDDEDEDGQLYPRTYIIEQNNRNSGRPRMWDGSYNAVKPPLPSMSSSLSRSSSSSLTSKKCHKSKESSSITSSYTCSHRHRRRRSGVTFNNSVTVYPIFKTSVYTPAMILAMYTPRDELRVNKLRNKREYAYEDYDWRNVVQEIDMTDGPSTGCAADQLVHPVHATTATTTKDKTIKNSSNSRSPSPRNVVQTYSSAFGGFINGSSMTSFHGAKRMRMYYP